MDARLDFNKQISDRFRTRSIRDRKTRFVFRSSSSSSEDLFGDSFRYLFLLSPAPLHLGSVYLLTTPASYTSHAMLLIDSSKLRVLRQQDAPLGDTPIDTAQVETQVEILKSENIGLSVIKDLKLNDDPEFAGSGGGPCWRHTRPHSVLRSHNRRPNWTRQVVVHVPCQTHHHASGPNLRPGYRLHFVEPGPRRYNRQRHSGRLHR